MKQIQEYGVRMWFLASQYQKWITKVLILFQFFLELNYFGSYKSEEAPR